jgi:hypothetical protein
MLYPKRWDSSECNYVIEVLLPDFLKIEPRQYFHYFTKIEIFFHFQIHPPLGLRHEIGFGGKSLFFLAKIVV